MAYDRSRARSDGAILTNYNPRSEEINVTFMDNYSSDGNTSSKRGQQVVNVLVYDD